MGLTKILGLRCLVKWAPEFEEYQLTRILNATQCFISLLANDKSSLIKMRPSHWPGSGVGVKGSVLPCFHQIMPESPLAPLKRFLVFPKIASSGKSECQSEVVLAKGLNGTVILICKMGVGGGVRRV